MLLLIEEPWVGTVVVKLQLEAVHAAAQLLEAPAQAVLRYSVKLVIYCATTIYNSTGDLQVCQSTAQCLQGFSSL
jgi:hypothetical protein